MNLSSPRAIVLPPGSRALLGAVALLWASCATAPVGPASTAGAVPAAPPASGEYAIGADLSFLRQAEARGAKFKDGGVEKPGLQIFRDHGYNWIRLRLFHTPTQLPNNLDYTLAEAREAKALGYRFLLDFHYSDTWADPGKQFLPKAWEGKSHAELVQAVFAYTRDTIARFRDAGVMPDMVQIGNEVSAGMLWPDGRLPEHWDNFAGLVKAGIRGVEAGSGPAAQPRIMIHIDQGGNRARTKAFFDRLNSYGVEYDVIGQSYYPWWQGSLLELRDNLEFMADTYARDIILVEVAYNWKPAEYRDRPGPFPETPAGQREFLEEVNRLVLATPHGRGRGVFWWEPAVTGPLNRRGMFDDEDNALPVITVFDKFTRGKTPAHQP
jgi:arabinogalactan endo-1,4-beta-galactosidase